MASKSLMRSTQMLGRTQSENRSGNKDVEGKKLAVRKNQPFIAKPLKKVGAIKHKECMRNYAASIGGHVKDGCFEFMPPTGGDQQGKRDERCGACGCHRNFHKKEPSIPSLLQSPSPVLLYNGCHLWKSTQEQTETSERGEFQTNIVAVTSLGKRFIRTKYTKVQKGKMLEFAKKSGWRIIQ